jgi:hypothetical protein
MKSDDHSLTLESALLYIVLTQEEMEIWAGNPKLPVNAEKIPAPPRTT